MSLWPVIRDLFIQKATEVVIEEVVETAQELKGLGVEEIYTGHCTGNIAFRILKKELGEMVHALGTGETVIF